MNQFFIKLFVTQFTLLFTIRGFAQWETQNSGTHLTLNDVCFVDSLQGWVVGDSATILSTIDGGKTWKFQDSPIDTLTLEKVLFINENIGYAIGWGGVILTTKDGGRTWMQSESGVEYLLQDMSFINADTGWAAGSDLETRKRGVILHTKDGGRTWQKQFETYSPNIFTSHLFSAVTFLGFNDGWALASDFVDNFSIPKIYRTIDGGNNWSIIGHASGHLSEMSMASLDTIWGGGYSFGKSTDGGLNWQHQAWPSDYVAVVVDIHQIDGQTGWLLTRFITESKIVGSRILFTTDGGGTWLDIFSRNSLILEAMAYLHDNNKRYIWVVGQSGIILSYREHPTNVEMSRNQIPQTSRLKQNFPNPFNAGTTITFLINERQHVTLTIYDLVGHKIAILLSMSLDPGAYSLTWNGIDRFTGIQAASGIYFYELQSSSFVQRKKMILLN